MNFEEKAYGAINMKRPFSRFPFFLSIAQSIFTIKLLIYIWINSRNHI